MLSLLFEFEGAEKSPYSKVFYCFVIANTVINVIILALKPFY